MKRKASQHRVKHNAPRPEVKHEASQPGVRCYSDTEELESMRKLLDKRIEALQRELDEQKRRGHKEADVFRRCIAEVRSKEESMRKEMDKKVEEHHQELEEQKRRAREEADGFRKCIAEMQSKLEEDRHESGKFFAIIPFNPFLLTPFSHPRVFLVGLHADLASLLQRVYPWTGFHPTSAIGSTRRFTARSMNNACKTSRRMTWFGLLTI